MKQRALSSHRDGSVLIVVLVICLGLVSVTILLSHNMLMAYRGADNDTAAREADATMLGAVQYAETVLTNVNQPGDIPDPATYQSSAMQVGEGQFWFIGQPADGDTSDQPTFGLVDEASKLNLNNASYDMLMLLPNMTDDVAQAIVSWRTPATTATATPAASASTSSTGATVTTSTVKQAPFESIDELGLVIGGTDPSLLYGDDLNLNHVLDPEESSTGSTGAGQYNAGWLEYCTAHSRESNVLSDGTTKTNVIDPVAVSTLLDTELGSGRGRAIISRVRTVLSREGISSTAAVAVAGSSPARSGAATPSPTPLPVNTSWVKSVPEFYALSGLSADDFAKVGPYLANGAGKYTTGLININSASVTVLACVPGVGQDTAQALVTAREQLTSADLVPDNWSWVTTSLSGRALRAAGPYLTTRCSQVSADVAAVGRYGRGYRRTRFIIDISTGTPQVVYRRDLSYLGWALGHDARTSIAQAGGATP